MHTQAKLQAFAQHIIDTEGDTIGYWPEEFLVFKLFATSAGDITRKEIEDYKETQGQGRLAIGGQPYRRSSRPHKPVEGRIREVRQARNEAELCGDLEHQITDEPHCR